VKRRDARAWLSAILLIQKFSRVEQRLSCRSMTDDSRSCRKIATIGSASHFRDLARHDHSMNIDPRAASHAAAA
jgi:hypothetical protein